MKYFRLTPDYLLWELSFQNLTMLLATIPVYEPAEKKKDEEPAQGGPDKGFEDLASFLNL
ncbi:hypothetical protein GCM10023184_18540 [Flaviaesturariibacter amylovorans]|uniref:Uncharacterized protein n=1 Tax=Flaviaesturariibacter amylovorans TaxID=1084520 RepID=A0ABP8GQU7_9BACT